MSHVPPVPAANQAPFPIHERPHHSEATTASPAAITSKVGAGVKALPGDVTSLSAQASKFAKERPWATAALLGTVPVALFGSLRGRRG